MIRGPGGATWGANAVNGVINIVTKSAADTAGAAVTVAAGTFDGGTSPRATPGSWGPWHTGCRRSGRATTRRSLRPAERQRMTGRVRITASVWIGNARLTR